MSSCGRREAATDRIANRKIGEQSALKEATVCGGYKLYSDMVARSGLDWLLEETFSVSTAGGAGTIFRRCFGF